MVWSLLRESGHRIVAADLPGHGFAAEIWFVRQDSKFSAFNTTLELPMHTDAAVP